ncbi:fimbrial protein [Salmonella enterica]|nr:fimbrial protein [Salmonella enterica]
MLWLLYFALGSNVFKASFRATYGAETNLPGGIKIQTGQGMASGLAIQLAQGDSANQSPVAIGGTMNQVAVVNSAGTVQAIPLVARLVKTSDVLTPGKIYSTVTFTISYY